MISTSFITNILEEELTRKDLFLVDVNIRPGNRISVFIDNIKGVTLEECIEVSRFIESKLDRDKEDFELEVSSPGLDKPLKLPVQFDKNTGRPLDVVKTDGIKLTGILTARTDTGIKLQTEIKVKDSKGKKHTESLETEIKFEEIKTAKVVIGLKKK